MPKQDEDKKTYWYKFERKRRTFERWGTTRFQQGIIDAVKGVFKNLQQFGPQDTLRDLESEMDITPIEEAYKDVYERVGVNFARDAYHSVPQKSRKQDEALEDQWVDDMRNFATTEAGERIVAVSNTTRERIRRVLAQGVDEGLGIEEIAANMESSTAISRTRARTIARTEIVSASNRGSLTGAASTGLQLQKEWIHTPDGNARDTHIEAGQQDPIDHNEEFQVGAETAKYPGDPALSAANSINCRCTVASLPYD